ncbi:hypothetical protein [Galactobacter caseinivorans]|uniref:Uncharacterized protein n=1 Tax=Galactobacter caseinivorans TaxID=2676123 RepID=A0A496PH55_9MICC|nr:hypothetical protein [Galactobacter caseinivorans]RKW69799.1 hypothetical protein DWQ67_11975 [Galactobacter caseinivorans]
MTGPLSFPLKAAWRALPLIVAGFIPQFTSLLVIAVAVSSSPDGIPGLLGFAASLFSLSVIGTIGVSICTITALVRARTEHRGKPSPAILGSVIQRNLAYANTFSLLALVGSALALCLLVATNPEMQGVAVAYCVALLPGILCSPHSAVINGAYQYLDRNRENLSATASFGLIYCASGIFLLTANLPILLALTLFGLSQSCGTVAILALRVMRLRRHVGSPFLTARLRWDAQGIWDRLSASLDGAVFMIVFLVVQSAATTISPDTGDAIAVAIAFARLVAVPLKQVGITYGRLAVSTHRPLTPGRSLIELFLAASPYLSAALLGMLGYALWSGPIGGSLLLTLMIAAQIIIEPAAGVLFGYLKLAVSPRAGLLGLLLVYFVAVPALLFFLIQAGATAGIIWAGLLGARLLFAASNVVSLRTNNSPRHAPR